MSRARQLPLGDPILFGLVIAMGLRAMGIADDIVNLAFGLTLGAVAVAVAARLARVRAPLPARVARRGASASSSGSMDPAPDS